MGIHQLFQKLKPIQKTIHIRKYQGHTVGVDASVWLHQGAMSCCKELLFDEPTDGYITFFMSMIDVLLNHGVKPFIVFDGGPLPAKSKTKESRTESRKKNKESAIHYYNKKDEASARKHSQKTVTITWKMVKNVIAALKERSIEYIVSPYEADAQLAYLSRGNYVDAVISVDSDLLPYGVCNLIRKIDKNGEGTEISLVDFENLKGTSFDLSSFSEKKFIELCIMSKCDYLDNLKNIAITKAYEYVKNFDTIEQIVENITVNKKSVVPPDYLQKFRNAYIVFKHQYVIDPETKKMVPLNPFKEEDESVISTWSSFLGIIYDDETAINVATGEIDPHSLETSNVSLEDAKLHRKKITRSAPGTIQTNIGSFMQAMSNKKVSNSRRLNTNIKAVRTEKINEKIEKKKEIIITSKYFSNMISDAPPDIPFFKKTKLSRSTSSIESPTKILDSPRKSYLTTPELYKLHDSIEESDDQQYPHKNSDFNFLKSGSFSQPEKTHSTDLVDSTENAPRRNTIKKRLSYSESQSFELNENEDSIKDTSPVGFFNNDINQTLFMLRTK